MSTSELDAPDLVGWIVDLRGNGGGNMWPMIAGVGPVLGEGTAGAFVDPDDNVTLWGYANGASIADGSGDRWPLRGLTHSGRAGTAAREARRR